MRLLSRFMVDLPRLRELSEETGPGGAPRSDRDMVERLASALWGVFSHHRAVVDGQGAHYDLGSWRAAAELISDIVNCHYPQVGPPIRYMDCYMGVLVGEDHRRVARPLHRWIFERLHDAGCDWFYSYSPDAQFADRRERMRELSSALARAYQENAAGAVYAPLPSIVAAYQDVYGRLPEGWPTC
jgi:hypothetical protein